MSSTYFLLAIFFALMACERALGQSPPLPVTPEIVAPVQMIVDFGQAKRKVRVSHD